MILQSTSESIPFVPPWCDGDAKPRRYFLRAGSATERAMLEAELSGEYRAAEVWPYELFEAFTNGARAIFGDDADTVIGLAEQERGGEPLSETDAATLIVAREQLAEHYPAYRSLISQQQRRNELVPVLAFRRFCTGWEGLPDNYAAIRGVVTDQALATVPPLDLRVAGLEAFSLLYAGGQAKNSAAPSKLRAGRKTSRSGAVSKGAGRSGRTTGRKTPPSASTDESTAS